MLIEHPYCSFSFNLVVKWWLSHTGSHYIDTCGYNWLNDFLLDCDVYAWVCLTKLPQTVFNDVNTVFVLRFK